MSTPEEDLAAFFSMHCGHLSSARRDHLGRQYVSAIAASEARGFERAREMAAKVANEWEIGRRRGDARDLPTGIRAMKYETP